MYNKCACVRVCLFVLVRVHAVQAISVEYENLVFGPKLYRQDC